MITKSLTRVVSLGASGVSSDTFSYTIVIMVGFFVNKIFSVVVILFQISDPNFVD